LVENAGAGIAIEPEDPKALVGAINALSADPEVCRSLGQKGREYILQNFSRDRTAQTYIDVLEGMLRKP
jgi:hypothetical protein